MNPTIDYYWRRRCLADFWIRYFIRFTVDGTIFIVHDYISAKRLVLY